MGYTVGGVEVMYMAQGIKADGRKLLVAVMVQNGQIGCGRVCIPLGRSLRIADDRQSELDNGSRLYDMKAVRGGEYGWQS